MIKQKRFVQILFAVATLIAVSAFGDERSLFKTNSSPYGSDTFYSRHVTRERKQAVIIDGYFEGFTRGNQMVVRTQSGRQVVVRAPRGLKVYLDSRYYDSRQSTRSGHRNNTGYGYRVPESRLTAIDLRRGDFIRVEARPAGRNGLQVRSITLLGSQNDRNYGRQYDRRYDDRYNQRNDDWRRRAQRNRNYDPQRY